MQLGTMKPRSQSYRNGSRHGSCWQFGTVAALCLGVLISTMPGANGQLDETWTVTVRGQTVVVNPDGSFRINNISAPDSFGPGGPGTRPDFISDDFTRLTGFRSVGGATEYLFSEPFQIKQGETVFVNPGTLTITTVPPPLPVRIVAVPDMATLTEIGARTQVRVTATLANGNEQDVTPRISWTTYRSSNPGIATVDGDGLVTAVAAGSVFVTATNEGAATVTRIIVSPGDPLTTVEGLVLLEDGSPVLDATVTIPEQSRSVFSDADGMFSFSDVATELGDTITVTARLESGSSGKQTAQGLLLIGVALGIPLLPEGVTDAGIIVLAPISLEDNDNDGAPDGLEVFLGYDPNNDDSDDNGILDGAEDGDMDDVPDWVEFILGFDPAVSDSDGDDIPDGQEDGDQDGLSDASEIPLGLNPFNSDTDGDGFGDGEEQANNSDPLDDQVAPIGTVATRGVSYRFFSADTEGGAPQEAVSEPVSYRYFAADSTDDSQLIALSPPMTYRYFVSGAEGDGDIFEISPPLTYHYFAAGAEGDADLFRVSPPVSFQYE
jgi:hypothetical protein